MRNLCECVSHLVHPTHNCDPNLPNGDPCAVHAHWDPYLRLSLGGGVVGAIASRGISCGGRPASGIALSLASATPLSPATPLTAAAATAALATTRASAGHEDGGTGSHATRASLIVLLRASGLHAAAKAHFKACGWAPVAAAADLANHAGKAGKSVRAVDIVNKEGCEDEAARQHDRVVVWIRVGRVQVPGRAGKRPKIRESRIWTLHARDSLLKRDFFFVDQLGDFRTITRSRTKRSGLACERVQVVNHRGFSN